MSFAAARLTASRLDEDRDTRRLSRVTNDIYDLVLYSECGLVVSNPNIRRPLDTASRVTPFIAVGIGYKSPFIMQKYGMMLRASVAVEGLDQAAPSDDWSVVEDDIAAKPGQIETKRPANKEDVNNFASGEGVDLAGSDEGVDLTVATIAIWCELDDDFNARATVLKVAGDDYELTYEGEIAVRPVYLPPRSFKVIKMATPDAKKSFHKKKIL
jgi:hypothetical protein